MFKTINKTKTPLRIHLLVNKNKLFNPIYNKYEHNQQHHITSMSFGTHDTNVNSHMTNNQKQSIYCLRYINKTCTTEQCINYNLKKINTHQLISLANQAVFLECWLSIFNEYGFLMKHNITKIDEDIYNSIDWSNKSRTISIFTYYNRLSDKMQNSSLHTEKEKIIFKEYYHNIIHRILHSKTNHVNGLTTGCPTCINKL
jgi:hypothetical protein